MLAGWLGGSWDKEMSKSDLKQGLWETPTGESGIVCVCVGRDVEGLVVEGLMGGKSLGCLVVWFGLRPSNRP